PLGVPLSEALVAAPALVPPATAPARVPPLCAKAPAAAKPPVTRIVPTNLPILITSSFPRDHGHGPRVWEPAETVGSKIAPVSPVPARTAPASVRSRRAAARRSPASTVRGGADGRGGPRPLAACEGHA